MHCRLVKSPAAKRWHGLWWLSSCWAWQFDFADLLHGWERRPSWESSRFHERCDSWACTFPSSWTENYICSCFSTTCWCPRRSSDNGRRQEASPGNGLAHPVDVLLFFCLFILAFFCLFILAYVHQCQCFQIMYLQAKHVIMQVYKSKHCPMQSIQDIIVFTAENLPSWRLFTPVCGIRTTSS